MKEKTSILSGFIWKLLERSGLSIIHFVVQIVLARLLDPELYGVLSIMLVFVAIAEMFIESGFFSALVQNKDVTEEDYSSVLWLSLSVAAVMYGLVFLSAPLIADLYDIPGIETPLRVLALMLFPGALNLIYEAKATREMDFKKVFYGSTAGALISGAAGLVVAFLGGGLWALVVKSLLDVLASCVIMRFLMPIRLHFAINYKRVKVLFSFGWKLLASSIWSTLYGNLSKLLIGKKYNMEALAHYERGNQFPDLIINTVNQAVNSVMFPAMSAEQDEPQRVKALMKNTIVMSSYLIFPMMLGLAAVGEPLIRLVLTEKWLPCVPFMQLCCLAMVLDPLHSCNLQAVNAMGRSDLFLKLEVIKTIMDIPFFLIAIFCFETPLAIAAYGTISSWVCLIVNSWPNKKLINYSGWEQLKDVFPTMMLSLCMFFAVTVVGTFCAKAVLPDMVTLIVQVAVGIAVYVVASVVFKPYPFRMALEMLKKRHHKDDED